MENEIQEVRKLLAESMERENKMKALLSYFASNKHPESELEVKERQEKIALALEFLK